MRRSGSKSLLQRAVEKALPNAMVRRKSPEYPNANIPKSIDEKHHGAAPQGAIMEYYAPHTITPESRPELDCGYHKRQTYHSDRHTKPPRCRGRDNRLSIQTRDYTIDESPRNIKGQAKRLDLDNFIRKIESWTPPSPREVLARRLFREVQRATSTHPRTIPNQPSAGGYLVHRRIKTGCAF
ncbi:hypothetical protein RSAG8_07644, partial [Rhizoctonia solani AG-8 WAC10335]